MLEIAQIVWNLSHINDKYFPLARYKCYFQVLFHYLVIRGCTQVIWPDLDDRTCKGTFHGETKILQERYIFPSAMWLGKVACIYTTANGEQRETEIQTATLPLWHNLNESSWRADYIATNICFTLLFIFPSRCHYLYRSFLFLLRMNHIPSA